MHGINTSTIHHCNHYLGGYNSFRLRYKYWTVRRIFDPWIFHLNDTISIKSLEVSFSILSKLLLDIHVIQFLVSQ